MVYSITNGLTTGDPYQFKVRAKNVHGWGDYSDIITVTPASPPSQPNAITTEIDNIYVKIAWEEPTLNGATIDAYKVIIVSGDGLTWAEASTCDGTDLTIIADKYCLVPMSELTDPMKFDLPYGRLIVAKVQAKNSSGWSQLSDSNIAGASVEVVPQSVKALSRGGATTQTQIEVTWDALTTTSEVGGSTCAITSYRVQWD